MVIFYGGEGQMVWQWMAQAYWILHQTTIHQTERVIGMNREIHS